ncbi:unnamed protein product [Cunninghamella blakesleeana]
MKCHTNCDTPYYNYNTNGAVVEDIELLKYDEDLVQQLKDDRTSHMRSSPNYTESLKNRIKGPQIEKRSNTTSTFIMHPVTISANKAKINATFNGELVFDEFGITFNGSPKNGQYYIDYDYNIYRHGLVLKGIKNKQLVTYKDNKSKETKFYHVSDSYLLHNTKDSYFQVFKETVKQCGKKLRPSIEREETFEEEHITRYIWKTVSSDGKNGEIYTSVKTDHPNSLHVLIKKALDELNPNEEECAWWQDIIDHTDKYSKISKLPQKIVGKDNYKTTRGKDGRIWSLPPYIE